MTARENLRALAVEAQSLGIYEMTGDDEMGQTGRLMSPAEFEAKHPGCCPHCGWSMRAHPAGDDPWTSCPTADKGFSPAAKEGDVEALIRYAASAPHAPARYGPTAEGPTVEAPNA